MPIKAVKKKTAVLVTFTAVAASSISLRNIVSIPIENIPVFINGVAMAAIIVAVTLLFFDRSLYISPDTYPAAVPITRQMMTVITGW